MHGVGDLDDVALKQPTGVGSVTMIAATSGPSAARTASALTTPSAKPA